MSGGWKLYWGGFLLLLLYGVVPPMLAGRSETTIRMTKGQEQSVEFFQPFRGPLNVSVQYDRVKAPKDEDITDKLGSFDVIIHNDVYHYNFRSGDIARISPSIPHVKMGNNIINLKIIEVPEILENRNINIVFKGYADDLKRESFRPAGTLDFFSFLLLVFFYLFFGLLGLLGQVFFGVMLKKEML